MFLLMRTFRLGLWGLGVCSFDKLRLKRCLLWFGLRGTFGCRVRVCVVLWFVLFRHLLVCLVVVYSC